MKNILPYKGNMDEIKLGCTPKKGKDLKLQQSTCELFFIKTFVFIKAVHKFL